GTQAKQSAQTCRGARSVMSRSTIARRLKRSRRCCRSSRGRSRQTRRRRSRRVRPMKGGYTLDRPTALTCPECGGARKAGQGGTPLQIRRPIGHGVTPETMLAGKLEELEYIMGSCLAMLNERIELYRLIAEHEAGADQAYKSKLKAAETQAHERAEALRAMLQSEWIQPTRGNDERST